MLALDPTGGRPPFVTCVEREAPRPAPNEAVVAVEAFSVNRGETYLLERPRVGLRPGKDVAGRVFEEAADGSGPPAGTRVVGHPPQGGWAELAAVPSNALCPLPNGVSTLDAAALPLAGLTALRLIRAAPLLDGQRVLITGASGGVGHFFVELAVQEGARVTAITASAERGRRLLRLGAEAVVDAPEHASGGFDVVFESVGGEAFSRALAVLRPRGVLVWFGQAGREPVTLDFFALFGQTGATIRHFHYEDCHTTVADDLATLVDRLACGRLHPEIGLVADWGETGEVIRRLREREIRGKAVLLVPARA